MIGIDDDAIDDEDIDDEAISSGGGAATGGGAVTAARPALTKMIGIDDEAISSSSSASALPFGLAASASSSSLSASRPFLGEFRFPVGLRSPRPPFFPPSTIPDPSHIWNSSLGPIAVRPKSLLSTSPLASSKASSASSSSSSLLSSLNAPFFHSKIEIAPPSSASSSFSSSSSSVSAPGTAARSPLLPGRAGAATQPSSSSGSSARLRRDSTESDPDAATTMIQFTANKKIVISLDHPFAPNNEVLYW